jgi:hypothetical protein
MYRDAYVEAVPASQVEAAVTLALRLYGNQPGWGLKRCAVLAVQHTFCPCVTGLPRNEEPGLGVIVDALSEEVLRRAEAVCAEPVERVQR